MSTCVRPGSSPSSPRSRPIAPFRARRSPAGAGPRGFSYPDLNAAYFGASNVLGPTIARDELGGAAAWGFILSAQAAGLVAGGLLMLWLRPRRILLVSWRVSLKRNQLAYRIIAIPFGNVASRRLRS